MSDHNNIYNIMGKLNALTPKEEPVTQTKQKVYESVDPQGSILEGVKKVEANLSEKYMGFKKTVSAIKKGGSAENPEAVAAEVGRKKYGKKAFQKAAAAGKKMGEEQIDEINMDVLNHLASHPMAGPLAAAGGAAVGAAIGKGIKKLAGAHKYFGPNQKKPANGKMGEDYQSLGIGMEEDTCNECGMYESECECDHDHMHEERETLKTKKGTIYKGGKYGTEYNSGEEGDKKPKAKTPGQGRGRPKAEKPAEYSKMNDPFGRVSDTAHKGAKGSKVKGKGNQDTIDEVITKKTPAGEIIKDFQKSKNPKFAGKSKAQRTKQALGAYYGMHPEKSKVKEGQIKVGKALLESVNFKKMMDECSMTMEEMLECINQDIKSYKATGDMSDRLRDFMHLHNHVKKMEETKMDPMAPQMPTGQDILPTGPTTTLGKIGHGIKNAVVGKSDDELLRDLHKDTIAPTTTVDEELNELAKLAGITDEGNAFTGALAKAKANHADSFEVDGEEFPVDEGNAFSGALAKAKADHDDSFEVDGHEYPVKESKTTNLEDIARLSGIYQEGRDYGDTSFNEPPTYDNTPDEQIQDEDVLLRGGDGEVAGQEKKMAKGGAARFSDNPMATESKELLKPAAEFNFVKEMGRDLIQAYVGIKK